MPASVSGVLWIPRVHWGLFIATYLFLGGVSGGSYVTSATANFFLTRAETEVERLARTEIARWGGLIAVLAISVGGGALLYHLGAPLKALQFPILFSNFGSWLVVGTWLIVIFSLLIVLDTFWMQFGRHPEFEDGLSLFPRRLLGLVKIDDKPMFLNHLDEVADLTRPSKKLHTVYRGIGFVLGAGVIVYTAMLLSALWTCPLWNRSFLPPLFLMSGVSTGIAATVAMTTISSGLSETVHRYSLADDALIVVEFAILGGLFFTLQHGCNAARRTVESLQGTFFSEFFIGVIGLGLLLPLVMSLVMTTASWRMDLEARSQRYQQVFTAGYTVKYGLVLVGGFLLRYVIIFAAVKLPLNVP